MATKTPIAALNIAVEATEMLYGVERWVTDARAALEDVEALVRAAERVRYLMDEGEEQMKTAAWTIAWNDAAEALRAALVKFQASHEHASYLPKVSVQKP